MAQTHYKIKQRLVVQVLAEIEFAEQYRNSKTKEDWRRNDEVMRGFQEADDSTRNKVPLYQAIAFEETLLSKIDNSLTFKFEAGGLEDKKKAIKFNSLRERDAKVDRWDKKDRMSKRHMIKYGRKIDGYTASSEGGEYKPNYFNIRPRHFYIDPDCGNDKEKALYLGWYGVKKGKWELLQGVKKGIYDKKAVDDLIMAGGNYNDTEETVDERNAGASPLAGGTQSKKKWRNDIFIFYQAFTTNDDGERYLLLLTKSGMCIRCQKFTDIDPSGIYPIATAASSPDDAEFWSIAPVTRVRRMFRQQEKSIGQMLDNSDQINKPKIAVNVDFIRNMSQIKYGTKGFIEVTGNQDINTLVKPMITAPTTGPMLVFDKLQNITDRQSGVTPETAGVSDTKGVLGIVDANIQALGDRINLLNRELSEGIYEFAVLYKNGVRNHLTGKVAIRVLGPNGLGMEDISWGDLKPTDYDYDIIISSSTSEAQASDEENKQKLTVLEGAKKDPLYNQRIVREKELEYSGFNEDEKRALLDVQDGSEGMMIRAYEDFEKLLLNKEVTVPRNANAVYLQVMNDLWEERDDLIDKQFGARKAPIIHKAIENYIGQIQAVVEKNLALDAAMAEAKAGGQGDAAGGTKIKIDPATGQPIEPVAGDGEAPVDTELPVGQ